MGDLRVRTMIPPTTIASGSAKYHRSLDSQAISPVFATNHRQPMPAIAQKMRASVIVATISRPLAAQRDHRTNKQRGDDVSDQHSLSSHR